jgi:predicted transcriptional regulator
MKIPDTKVVTIIIRRDIDDAIERKAKRERRLKKAIIEEALEQYCKKTAAKSV